MAQLDGLMIMSYDDGTGAFTQHCFDSRGVIRLFKMSLRDGVWTLWRDQPDVIPSALRAAVRGRVLLRRRHHRGPLGNLA